MSRYNEIASDAQEQSSRIVSQEELIAGHKADGRTVYRREAKARLVAAATVAGTSVAKVARDHGLNANQLHAWIRVSTRRAGEARPFAAKIGSAMLAAAMARTRAIDDVPVTSSRARGHLVPVVLTGEPAQQSTANAAPGSVEPSMGTALVIEVGGARILVDGHINRAALVVVLDCLRNRMP